MSEASILSEYLGKNLVQLRQKKGLTQVQLSQLSGLPRSTLANLETGAGNPSLTNLARLASSLKVSVDELLARPSLEIEHLSADELSVKSRKGGMINITQLLPRPIPGVELEKMVIEAGEVLVGSPHLKGTKEYFHLLKGLATIRVAGESFTMEEGDVIVFPGDEKHSYENSGRKQLMGVGAVIIGK